MNTSTITTKKLQQHLKDLGLYKDSVDGVYGKNTREAVVALQRILTQHSLYNYKLDGSFGKLTQRGLNAYLKLLPTFKEPVVETPTRPALDYTKFIYGAKLSDEFLDYVWWMAGELRHPSVTQTALANDFIGCMAWETNETFSPYVINAAGSGATGLIQFMPATAKDLGTTTAALAKMTQLEQLEYVYKYFKPRKGKLRNLGDVYMTILWPLGIGKSDSYILWSKTARPTTYRQNIGLDVNKDGNITRGECIVKVKQRYDKGLKLMRK